MRSRDDHAPAKILLLGDIGVGKTALLKRYVHNIFPEHYRATVGVDFALKKLAASEIGDDSTDVRKLPLQLWDVAGRDTSNMMNVYAKETQGVMLVLSATDLEGTKGRKAQVASWCQSVSSVLVDAQSQPIPIVIFVNKCDLAPSGTTALSEEEDGWREVVTAANANVADPIIFHGSAKTGETVSKAFQYLASAILKSRSGSQEAAQAALVPLEAEDAGTPPSTRGSLFYNVKNTPVDFWKGCKSLPPAGKVLLVTGLLCTLAALITIFTVPSVTVQHISPVFSLKLLVAFTSGLVGGASIAAAPILFSRRRSVSERVSSRSVGLSETALSTG